jgi:hypothetical protein
MGTEKPIKKGFVGSFMLEWLGKCLFTSFPKPTKIPTKPYSSSIPVLNV